MAVGLCHALCRSISSEPDSSLLCPCHRPAEPLTDPFKTHPLCLFRALAISKLKHFLHLPLTVLLCNLLVTNPTTLQPPHPNHRSWPLTCVVNIILCASAISLFRLNTSRNSIQHLTNFVNQTRRVMLQDLGLWLAEIQIPFKLLMRSWWVIITLVGHKWEFFFSVKPCETMLELPICVYFQLGEPQRSEITFQFS